MKISTGDLVENQLIGFLHAKNNLDILVLIKAAHVSVTEWINWRQEYGDLIDEDDVKKVNNYLV